MTGCALALAGLSACAPGGWRLEKVREETRNSLEQSIATQERDCTSGDKHACARLANSLGYYEYSLKLPAPSTLTAREARRQACAPEQTECCHITRTWGTEASEGVTPVVPFRRKNVQVDRQRLNKDRGKGYLLAEYVVDTEGRVGDIQIIAEEPFGAFNQEVKEALSQYRFKPARENGTPVPVRMRYLFRYNSGLPTRQQSLCSGCQELGEQSPATRSCVPSEASSAP